MLKYLPIPVIMLDVCLAKGLAWDPQTLEISTSIINTSSLDFNAKVYYTGWMKNRVDSDKEDFGRRGPFGVESK
jgi:hypothetical protein